MVFQWHGDTFSRLPEDAVCLSEGDARAHQALICKESVFGFQFHWESTRETIENLVNHCGDEMVPGDVVQSAEEILPHPEYILQCNERMDMFRAQLPKMWKARI